jgi:hypothetical protein
VAGHEVYAASALSVVAAILVARWCLTGRRSRRRTAVESRWTARTDASCAQRAVREAEDLVHGYWRRLSPLYLSTRDHHQR